MTAGHHHRILLEAPERAFKKKPANRKHVSGDQRRVPGVIEFQMRDVQRDDGNAKRLRQSGGVAERDPERYRRTVFHGNHSGLNIIDPRERGNIVSGSSSSSSSSSSQQDAVASPLDLLTNMAVAAAGARIAPQARIPPRTVVKKIPCRAYGMGEDHKFENAYFVMPDDIKHGQDLVCSHPKCQAGGVKFKFCLHCHLPVAKNNFKKRHSHESDKSASAAAMPMQCLPVGTQAAAAAIKIPCRSRFMPANHTFETAHFTIPADIEHGQELVCSYPACREGGVKFCFCSFCQLPVAKRNFRKRHMHVDEAAPKATKTTKTTNHLPIVPTVAIQPQIKMNVMMPTNNMPIPPPPTAGTFLRANSISNHSSLSTLLPMMTNIIPASPNIKLEGIPGMPVSPEMPVRAADADSHSKLPKKKMLKRRADGAASFPPSSFRQQSVNMHVDRPSALDEDRLDRWRALLGDCMLGGSASESYQVHQE